MTPSKLRVRNPGARAERSLEDYVALVEEGHVFNNGDLNSYLRVVQVIQRHLGAWSQSGNPAPSASESSLQRPSISAAISMPSRTTTSLSALVPPAPAKPIWRSRWRFPPILNKRVSRIVLTRPAVEAGEHLGFLPGTLQEKVDPYLRPLYDALFDMIDTEKVERLIEKNVIEIAPLAFMRGRTLNDCFIILDEAQNTSIEQMKMVLTRQASIKNGDHRRRHADRPPSGKKSGILNAVEV